MATVLLFMVYLPSGMLYSYLLNWISLPNLVGLMTTSLTSISAPVVYFYCATLHGPFCPPNGDVNLVQGQIAQIAQSVTGTARVASNVLDSVIQLSEPGHLALHQTEIIELPYAILWSSELPEKDQLSNDLNELSTLSGELRNKLYGLNRQGLNSFSSISHEFLRLQDLLYWVQTGDKKYTSETIANNLEILVFHLSTELTQLVNTIENLIPLAHRKLADLTSYSGQQLSHDLSLNSESIKSLKETWMQLEQIRLKNNDEIPGNTAGINRSNTAVRAVLEQPCSTGGRTGTVRPKHLPPGRTGLSDQFLGPVAQDQPGPVGQICPTSWLLLRSDSASPTTGRTRLFEHRSNCRVRPVNAGSASFIGWHMADHHLTPEDELFSLRKVIENFQTTINQIKSSS
ncbi:hypothetical protein PCASD_26031 [Puccinia coronata f. sp. avenae]|uniref:Uncharacterized protein n=1 Tax=Puccinia coronata f. sp. avenae TaxID=200324 RepID=A0A2N5RZ05_9BASI|nr:hypothetical protein PCASD_26031 [Puccinia coronata f. sp. avenae]